MGQNPIYFEDDRSFNQMRFPPVKRDDMGAIRGSHFRRRWRHLTSVAAVFCGAALLLAAGGKDEPRRILLMAGYTSVDASSAREDPNGAAYGYAEVNAIDLEPRTAWCASDRMLGVGEWIEVGLLVPMDLSRIGIIGTLPPGNDKTPPDGTALPYNRIKSIRISNAVKEFRTVELRDTAALQYQNFTPLGGDRFRIAIESVYPGSERAVTCVSQLEFWGKSASEGAAVDKLSTKAIQSDLHHVFANAFGGQRAALAGTLLKNEFQNLFTRYNNYSPIALAREISSCKLPDAVAARSETTRADETACVVALRALYEASPHARRLLREKYFSKEKLPLGEGCGLTADPLYWVLQGRKDSIPLFWHRGEHYGLLETGDARALEPFLALFRGDTAPYHWWEKPVTWHGAPELTPAQLVSRLSGPYPRRVLARLIEQEQSNPGYRLDGLLALQKMLGP